jgi:hypothetical protein
VIELIGKQRPESNLDLFKMIVWGRHLCLTVISTLRVFDWIDRGTDKAIDVLKKYGSQFENCKVSAAMYELFACLELLVPVLALVSCKRDHLTYQFTTHVNVGDGTFSPLFEDHAHCKELDLSIDLVSGWRIERRVHAMRSRQRAAGAMTQYQAYYPHGDVEYILKNKSGHEIDRSYGQFEIGSPVGGIHMEKYVDGGWVGVSVCGHGWVPLTKLSYQRIRDGHAVIYFFDGCIARGTYVNGKLNGNVRRSFPNGDIEEEVIWNGIREGEIILRYLKPVPGKMYIKYVNGKQVQIHKPIP